MRTGKGAARLEVSLVEDPQYGGGLSSRVFSSVTFCTIFKNIASNLTGPSSLDEELKDEINLTIRLYSEAAGRWLKHTRVPKMKDNAPNNVPPGIVVDTQICHPKNNDFYMCAQAGMIGTTRPIHYQVLHVEIWFSGDDLQELVHSLSYAYQRSTTAISIVGPIYYAHLAAAQMGQFIILNCLRLLPVMAELQFWVLFMFLAPKHDENSLATSPPIQSDEDIVDIKPLQVSREVYMASIVPINSGPRDWYYKACKKCSKKVDIRKGQ
ncbi:hypothetical protein PIB30_092051 [Stylosanthes scabra]|uniref:Piwi domain-containing protein n=1 Tax=Stylosanthes scabra TaxID=79078 RepID=A0ABU6QW53_9FABA|nr:hypothetical protein [Stylosanthes scabra]